MTDRPPTFRPADRPVVAVATDAAPVRRVLWGAIFAGVVVALVVQLLLNLLGIGIGLETLDPAQRDVPSATSFGIGAGIWWLLATLIALFAGGWVAGRMAGLPLRVAGGLHGLVVWSVATLVGLYLATSVVGSIASGVFGALGAGASAVAQGVSAAGSAVTQPDRGTQGSATQGGDAAAGEAAWARVEQEVRGILQQTGES